MNHRVGRCALAAAGVVAFRRGKATAATLGGPADALATYLGTAGLGTAGTRAPGETGGRDENLSP